MQSKIKALVWNEFIHEQKQDAVKRLYPDGIHACIAGLLQADGDIEAQTATLQEDEHGLGEKRLADTDVLFWWGHMAHDKVDDRIVRRVVERVWQGMGLVVLHSGHNSKVFQALMGTSCNLRWREAGERSRLWVTNPRHPIAAGLPAHFELEHDEMYGEPFGVPEPLETVFITWFEGGEVFRSGLTYRRGSGGIFYFQPGHEAYPIYHDSNIGQVLRNAARWANNPGVPDEQITDCPNVPVEQSLEPLEEKGPSVHE